jgi:hypothetical protein
MGITRRFVLAGAMAGLGTVAGADPARAGLIVTMTESGGDVVIAGGGTADLTALTGAGGAAGHALIDPDSGIVAMGTTGSDSSDIYTGSGGPDSFGTGSTTNASTAGGDVFGIIFDNNLIVPRGYASGGALSATATYAGSTFVSLGVTPGTYVWTWGTGANADSFTLQIGPVATVPEPSSVVMTGIAALAGIGYARRRRRAA